MAFLRIAAFALTFFCLGTADAQNLWTIYWMSAPHDCDGWGAPIVSPYYPACNSGAIPVSICPNMASVSQNGPYTQTQPITIVGYTLVQILPPGDSGYAIVGSFHTANGTLDGADVFGMTGGSGTNSTTERLPAPLPQGGPDSHIDIYGFCNVGPQQFLLKIDYISPSS